MGSVSLSTELSPPNQPPNPQLNTASSVSAVCRDPLQCVSAGARSVLGCRRPLPSPYRSVPFPAPTPVSVLRPDCLQLLRPLPNPFPPGSIPSFHSPSCPLPGPDPSSPCSALSPSAPRPDQPPAVHGTQAILRSCFQGPLHYPWSLPPTPLPERFSADT